MNKPLRNSLILTAVLIAAALILLAVSTVFQQIRDFESEPQIFEVLVKGEVIGQFSLLEDREIPVEDLCVIRVSGGEVSVSSSTCPRQSCVCHAPISRAGECIVCLPNQVTVRIPGDGTLDFVL